MANIYVRSTDGSDGDSGATWALAKATLVGAGAVEGAGDTVYLSQVHDGTQSAPMTLTRAGTPNNMSKVLCANDAGEPPTALAQTALVSCTGTGDMYFAGSGYYHGITFSAGTASDYSRIYLITNGTRNVFNACKIRVGGSHSSSSLTIGPVSAGQYSTVHLIDSSLRFSSADQGITPRFCEFLWKGGSLESGGTSPSVLFRYGDYGSSILVEDVDLSAASATMDLVENSSVLSSDIIFRRCKLPAAWSGSIGTVTGAGRILMHNCDSGATNYRLWVVRYTGSTKSETAIYCTGGASDGTTNYSFRLESSASVGYPGCVHASYELPATWNSVTGSSVTVEVEIVRDSATALTDKQVWLEVSYSGSSSSPLGAGVSDSAVSVLASATDQTSSAAGWTTTGLSTPLKQKLSVTFTPQMAGYLQAVVKLAVPSTVIYVDPKLTVS